MKYVLVSGGELAIDQPWQLGLLLTACLGVISGIGKGVIGLLH